MLKNVTESVGLSPDLDGLFHDRKFIHIEMFDDLMQASKKKCSVVSSTSNRRLIQSGDVLWKKLMQENITGKCFNLIFNMHKGIKSQISINEGSTVIFFFSFFYYNIGVGQGESLSPNLFTFYLNDLESFFSTRQVNSIECHVVTDETPIYFKLLILLQMTQCCSVIIAMIYYMP